MISVTAYEQGVVQPIREDAAMHKLFDMMKGDGHRTRGSNLNFEVTDGKDGTTYVFRLEDR